MLRLSQRGAANAAVPVPHLRPARLQDVLPLPLPGGPHGRRRQRRRHRGRLEPRGVPHLLRREALPAPLALPLPRVEGRHNARRRRQNEHLAGKTGFDPEKRNL